MKPKRLLILGVTASGKSRLAFELARQLHADLMSIDSMKVYRRMDIGTAKPSAQQRKQVPVHLVDVVEPSDPYSVGRFVEQAAATIAELEQHNKPVIAVGGTALYIKALLCGLFDGPGADETIRRALLERVQSEGLGRLYEQLQQVDPTACERIDRHDERRIVRALEVHQLTGRPISSFQTQFTAESEGADWLLVGLRREKEQESRRINSRVKRMVEAGLVEEVKHLMAEVPPPCRQAQAAIGYAEIIAHLEGQMDLETAIEKIKINTRRLAKSQRTWFKTFRQVTWLDITLERNVEDLVEEVLRLWQS